MEERVVLYFILMVVVFGIVTGITYFTHLSSVAEGIGLAYGIFISVWIFFLLKKPTQPRQSEKDKKGK